MKKLKYFLLFALILIPFFRYNTVSASEFLSDKAETKYDVSSGLITGKGNAICQTEDGYIWIGQYAGLTKYDSKKFYTMTNYNDINLTSIVSIASWGNSLLIGSEKGLFFKDDEGVFKKIDTGDESVVVKDIQVCGDVAFIGTTTGLYKYLLHTGFLVRINSYNISRVTVKDMEHYYYLVGKSSVYYNNDVDSIIEDNIKSILYHENKLYLGLRDTGYIRVIDLENSGRPKNGSQELIEVKECNSTINDLLIKNDEIYVCADNGFHVGPKDNIKDTVKVKSYNETYNRIEHAFFDYEDNLWLVSSSQGVYKITQNQIQDFFFEVDLPNVTTYSMEKYHDYTFIGTDNGIYILDKKNNIINDRTYTNTTDVKGALNVLINTIGNHAVRDIEVYKSAIYFATYGTLGNLYRFDFNEIESGNFLSFLKYDDLSQNRYIDEVDEAKDFRCLHQAEGFLFVGLDKGVSKYDGSNYSFIETGVYPLYITSAMDDIYVVLNTVGVAHTNMKRFDHLERLDPYHTYSVLKCMFIDDGVVFSDNNDLYYYKNRKITKLNLDVVGSVVDLVYVSNSYYVCSEANVYIVDDIFKKNPKYTVLDLTNGLKSSLVANSSGYFDYSERAYYFVTSSGVLKYNILNKAPSATIKRKIAINQVKADETVLTGNEIKLNNKVNTLEIDFSVLSFKSDQHYKVYYMLEGYDNEYHVLDSKDSFNIIYRNLAGGEYKFRLYTEDNDGMLCEKELEVLITKDKKITEFVIFWILLVMLIVSAIAGLFFFIFRTKIQATIKRRNEYKAITLEAIEAIARTIDAKDSYTNGHSKRVGIYSREIAKALGLSETEVENIYYIALLHDIGKIAIPENILNKPGRLTDEEFNIMKSHTTAGAKILESISTIPNIKEGALYHHEKYSGGGYPTGIKGEEIPFIARIICCADCYDAMATRRVYKEPYPKEKIIEEFERCKETQFDPKIADVVINLIKEDKMKQGTEYKDNKEEVEKL